MALSQSGGAFGAEPHHRAPLSPADYVNPFGGTDEGASDFGTGGGAGNTYPGAVAPFGMVQWSPHTVPSTTNFGSGYSYGDKQIGGFSLTHLSGPGCAALGDIPFMPTVQPVAQSPVATLSSNLKAQYVATFDHAHEQASPGQYTVTLNPGSQQAIGVELAATERTGAARIAFPSGHQTGTVLINAGGSAMANTNAQVAIDPPRREVSGMASGGGFCYEQNQYNVYFAAIFDRPFAAHGTWKRDVLQPGSTASSDLGVDPRLKYQPTPTGIKSLPGDPSATAQAGAYVSFDTARQQHVSVRVGVSFVSVANARLNLAAENATPDIERVRLQAHDAWNKALNRIEVSGGSSQSTKTFYTMLYHALLHPNVFSDVNGDYAGMDGRTHRANGFAKYANFSGWDVYRDQIPLVAILAPNRASDIVSSFLADAAESGWLPKWPVAQGQTGMMVGDPALPAIASAYAFGARHFDAPAALAAMVKGATQDGRSSNGGYIERPGSLLYQQLGYLPAETERGVYGPVADPSAVWGPVSTTIEYAIADFSLARFAGRVCGQITATACNSTYATFMARSDNWRNVFNPAARYVEPRLASGQFAPGYDPTSGTGMVEGSGAQYTMSVPQNPAGLFQALGGRTAAAGRLDHFFTQLNAGPQSEYAFLGNEPTLGTPYLYNWLGQPYKTQRIVRKALLGLYNSTPTGYPGNDDLGAMSAWYVFGALGMYPAVPGEDVLALSSPLFPRVVLHLAGGDVTLTAPMAAPDRPYVNGLTLNGQAHSASWLRFSDLACGARLNYALSGSSAVTQWGQGAGDLPPSFPANAAKTAPVATPKCATASTASRSTKETPATRPTPRAGVRLAATGAPAALVVAGLVALAAGVALRRRGSAMGPTRRCSQSPRPGRSRHSA